MSTRRGVCRVCDRELQVTADGKVRIHGYARGGGNLEERCPGSGEPPKDMVGKIACFWCHGAEGGCTHCDGTGEVNVDQVQSYDAVIVVERVLEKMHGFSDAHLAAATVEALMRYGFVSEMEEVPEEKVGQAHETEALLMVALMEFYETWKQTAARGPQKPEVVLALKKVEEAQEAFRRRNDS